MSASSVGKRAELARVGIFLAAMGLLAASCMVAAPPPQPPSVGAASLAPPFPPAAPESDSEIVATASTYRIQAGDIVEIKFPFHREEDTEAQVRPDGKIGLPLVGEVAAAGLTPDELAQSISQSAAELLVDPVVSVTVRRFGEQKIYVGGEVRNPGFVPYYPGLTPLLAVIYRGGFKATANPKKVVWISGASGGGEYKVEETDLEAVIEGKATDQVALGPNDVVYVPASTIGKMNNFVDLYVRGLIPTIPRAGFRLPP